MFLKNLIVFLFINTFLLSHVTATKTLTIEGTGDSQELLQELAKLYEKKYPNTSIIVPNSVGSSGGIKKVTANACELARVARPLKKQEKEKGLKNIIFAYSPIVFVINGKITNNVLSEKDIIGIFDGTLTHWEQLPNIGLIGKIYIVHREQGDSSRTILEENIPSFKDIQKSVGATAFYNQEAISMLTKYRNTIGYLAMGNVKNTNLQIVQYNGILPTLENIKMNKYNLVTPLGLVYKGKLNEIAKHFIEFLKSDEAKQIMHDYEIIPNL